MRGVGSAGGDEESLGATGCSQLRVVLESVGARGDVGRHRGRQLPQPVVRGRFERERLEGAARTRADEERAADVAPALRVVDSLAGAVDVVHEANALARKSEERRHVGRLEDRSCVRGRELGDCRPAEGNRERGKSTADDQPGEGRKVSTAVESSHAPPSLAHKATVARESGRKPRRDAFGAML